jgi:hypothetical protein
MSSRAVPDVACVILPSGEAPDGPGGHRGFPLEGFALPLARSREPLGWVRASCGLPTARDTRETLGREGVVMLTIRGVFRAGNVTESQAAGRGSPGGGAGGLGGRGFGFCAIVVRS